MNIKVCIRCGAEFFRRSRVPFARFAKRQFCSIDCALRHRGEFNWDAFDALIDRSGDCWIWLGPKSSRGYGRFRRNHQWVYAHRLSYEREYGPLGEAVAMHKCDTPLCVRPDHVLPGTLSENFKDMWRKGRGYVNHKGRAGNAAP